MWVVGNGELINVWKESWLIDGEGESFVTMDMLEGYSELRVYDLMN